ncbi:MAG: hypothetical protein IIC71_14910 [Acidobacteria bacterium]|nr:hypothetical protein [Acidobacteriota bacterium]
MSETTEEESQADDFESGILESSHSAITWTSGKTTTSTVGGSMTTSTVEGAMHGEDDE